MSNTEVSYEFKRKIYVGKIYLLDIENKTTVVTGYGSFDTEALTLNVQFDGSNVSSHDNLLTVLETQDGFFAPLMIRDFYSMGWGGHSSRHSMRRCMHWALSKGLSYILEDFNEIRVAIDAQPEEELLTQRFDKNGKNGSIEFKKSAKFSNLDSAVFSRYSCEVNSTYAWSSGNVRVRSVKPLGMDGRIAFIVKDTVASSFTFHSLNQALLAFKAYWMLEHGAVDCNILNFKLGIDIDFIFENSKLYAPHDDTPAYRSILSVSTEINSETLTKCIYFAVNPDVNKQLSFTSKIGLSLSSLIRHSYDKRPELLEHEAVSLIVGFQGIAESIAQNKISQVNKASKTKTLREIELVLQAVKSIESDLSNDVKDFYLKDEAAIYQALSRPTFKRSVEIALDELGIDKAKYDTTIAIVNRARKQIVHYENYDNDSLMDLITTAKNDVKKDKDGNITQMSLGVKVGELDKLYALMLDMMQRYFKTLTVSTQSKQKKIKSKS